ncbi:hypothetical protein CHK_0970 [Christensenella hongkongensis]|uniref:Uncharacterized protein n=1 Tax=Christensenella hongkongensis TaxID=270498 RepID=A0A0M2NH49_9FIRM|nr:hypothetical protein CHK_0970 [Christensenella hongkongensis]
MKDGKMGCIVAKERIVPVRRGNYQIQVYTGDACILCCFSLNNT